MLFQYLVKSIMMYAAEIWGWVEQTKLETIHEKQAYLRWILQLHWSVPKYIILEETKRAKIYIESGIRAVKFEQKIMKSSNEVLKNCLKEKIKQPWRSTKWSQKRSRYYQRNGHNGELSAVRLLDKNFPKELAMRDEENQKQEHYNRIQNSRYNTRYKQLITPNLPFYLQKDGNRDLFRIAQLRCEGRRYWIN